MPSYITNVGVQQVSITISGISVSGTATISAVGARAFIMYGGTTSTDNQANNSLVRITLTNSTTVTATRTNMDASTVTIKCSVVDATSDLVTSVQYGTVTLVVTNSSNTAAISAVNANTAALEYLGHTSSDTVTAPTTQMPGLTYAATTVTASVTTAVTSTMVVSFCMIEFNSAALNSNVQVFSTSWSNATTSTTQAITSVDTNNSIIIHGGQQSTAAGSYVSAKQRSRLTNSTTVTININTTGVGTNIYNFTAVEFISGVLSQPVQRNVIVMTGVNTNTAAINSTSLTKTAIYSLGSSGSASSSYGRTLVEVYLSNSTTVTAFRGSSNDNSTVSFEAAEFSSGGGSTLLLMGVG